MGFRTSLGFALALAASLGASVARADDGDGAYGRFDHALVLSAAAGAGVSVGAEPDGAAFVASLHARVLDAAGPFLELRGPGAPHTRLTLGVELRPLWPSLFLLDLSTGNEWLDTFVQSVGVDLGAAFDLDGGIALAYGFALEVPLVPSARGRAFDGLALRLAARRVRSDAEHLSGSQRAADWTLSATIALDLGVRFSASHASPPGYRPR